MLCPRVFIVLAILALVTWIHKNVLESLSYLITGLIRNVFVNEKLCNIS